MHTTLHPTMSDEVRPFKVEVPQAALEDLRQRLDMTRWPERERLCRTGHKVCRSTR